MNYSQLYRIQKINQLIRLGEFPSVCFLSNELEVSDRTIRRDLSYLRDSLCAPLKYDKQKEGYYYTEATWDLSAIIFSEQELLSLFIAKNALFHYTGIPYLKNLKSAFKKIIECLPKDEGLDFEKMDEFISFRFGAEKNFNPQILDNVFKAIRKNLSLKMKYFSAGRNEETERVVDPYHLDNLKGDWYLVGFCHLRNEIRTFCLDRILECYLLNKKFVKDPDFSYNEFIKDIFGIIKSDQPEKVVIRFRNLEARLVKERTWHRSQVITECENGDIIITLELAGLEEVKRWVLSAGKDARIIEPEWFKEKITREISQMLENYK